MFQELYCAEKMHFFKAQGAFKKPFKEKKKKKEHLYVFVCHFPGAGNKVLCVSAPLEDQRTVEFCPRWAQRPRVSEGSSSRGSWGSCGASEEVFVSGFWGLGFKGGMSLEEKPLRRGGERQDSTRATLNAECHNTVELCETEQGVTPAVMNAAGSANAGRSPVAAPSSWPLGTGREQGEVYFFTPSAASRARQNAVVWFHW